MKKSFVILLIFCLFFSAIPLVQVSDVKAEASTGSFGNSTVPVIPPVKFEDRKDSYFFNVSTYCIEFFKDTMGYDKIFDSAGKTLVYDSRFSLEYLSGTNWKQRGIATSVQVKQISDTEFEVTRYFNDYVSTLWKAVYYVKSELPTKVSVEINNGATANYRLLWSLSGITNTVTSEVGNTVSFKALDSKTADSFFVDYSDVYLNYGSITAKTVSDVAQGRKLDLTFSIGNVDSGKTFVLDPSFGYETVGSSDIQDGWGSSFILCKQTAPTTLNITDIYVYLKNGVYPNNATGVVFSDNAGVPGSLLGEGDVVNRTAGWVFEHFTGMNVTVTSGTAVWIGVYLQLAEYSQGDSGSANQTYVWSQGTYPTVPASYSPANGPTRYNLEASIFANYTALAPSTFTWTLQARDKDGANLPRQVTFNGNYDNGTAFSTTSDTAGLATITGVEAGNHTVYTTWQGHNSANSTVDFSANTTTNLDTRIARLDSGSNYALISLDTVDLPTPALEGSDNILLHDVSATGSLGIVIDHANWINTAQPSRFEAGGGQYNTGDGTWSWSSSVFSLTHSYSGTQDIMLIFPSGSSSNPPGSTTTEPSETSEPTPVPTDEGGFQIPELTPEDTSNALIVVIIILGGLVGAIILVNREPSRKSPRKQKSQLGRKKRKRESIL